MSHRLPVGKVATLTTFNLFQRPAVGAGRGCRLAKSFVGPAQQPPKLVGGKIGKQWFFHAGQFAGFVKPRGVERRS